VEAIKAQRSTAEIAKIYSVHPNPIGLWKRQALAGLPEVFTNGRDRPAGVETDKDELYRQIGVLQVELEFLKKSPDCSVEEKRRSIEPQHRHLSIERQCELLDLPRSSYYYQPRPESEENLRLMRVCQVSVYPLKAASIKA